MRRARLVHLRTDGDKMLQSFTIEEPGAFDLLVRYHRDQKLRCYTCSKDILRENYHVVSQSTIATRTMIYIIFCKECVAPIQAGVDAALTHGERERQKQA